MGYTLPGIPLFPQPINQSTAVRQQTPMPGIADQDRLKYHDDVDMLAKSYFSYQAPLTLDVIHFIDLYKKQKAPLYRNLTSEREGNLTKFLSLLCKDPAIKDVRWAAYMMATAIHEGRCAADKWAMTWAPVSETGGANMGYGGEVLVVDSTKHPLDVTGNKIDLVHDKNAKTKEIRRRYYGRGYVQLTHQDNYRQMDDYLQLNHRLHITPETALEMQVAYDIMSYGMVNGTFRHHSVKETTNGKVKEHLVGYKLSDFIGGKADYTGARNIINGDVDKNGKLIADYAVTFESMLQYSRLDFLLMAKRRQCIAPAYIHDHPELLDPPSTRPF